MTTTAQQATFAAQKTAALGDQAASTLAGNPSGVRLVLATHNPGKLQELREFVARELPELSLPESAVFSAADFSVPPPAEIGITFSENALLKARALAAATGLPAVADDSGLAVEVLGGAPGIFSARWAGYHGDDTANLQLLLNQLAEITEPSQRRAKFISAVALVAPDGSEVVTTGEMPGYLTTEPRGSGGFGYDPIFVADEQPPQKQPPPQSSLASDPPSSDSPSSVNEGPRTNAELTPAEKNAISHRAKAFAALVPHLKKVLVNSP